MLRALDDARRLSILRRYGILDTPPEVVFDNIARLAATHFHTPIGTVTFVDEARQWFKAIHGLNVRETGRDVAFCHHTIQSDEPMVVSDALTDPRFAGNPLVLGDPKNRFYAGAPLITPDGFRLGTVSVIDTIPHGEVPEEDRRFLTILAEMVVHELEVRAAASDVRGEIERRRACEQEARSAQERFGCPSPTRPWCWQPRTRSSATNGSPTCRRRCGPRPSWASATTSCGTLPRRRHSRR